MNLVKEIIIRAQKPSPPFWDRITKFSASASAALISLKLTISDYLVNEEYHWLNKIIEYGIVIFTTMAALSKITISDQKALENENINQP